jgi:hypothetical protein
MSLLRQHARLPLSMQVKAGYSHHIELLATLMTFKHD